MSKNKCLSALLVLVFAITLGCGSQSTVDNPLATNSASQVTTAPNSSDGSVEAAAKNCYIIVHYDKNKQGSCTTYDYIEVDDSGYNAHSRHKCDYFYGYC